MNPNLLSNTFAVRKLQENDVDIIYGLCAQNELFYQYHPPFVTKRSILDDRRALPPGKDYNDKYYVGFFENGTLVAIMDLITGYPINHTVWIGFFMMNRNYQGRGIGSNIVAECVEYLKALRFNQIRLGVDKGNPQSLAFWTKNRFRITDEGEYIIMELKL